MGFGGLAHVFQLHTAVNILKSQEAAPFVSALSVGTRLVQNKPPIVPTKVPQSM